MITQHRPRAGLLRSDIRVVHCRPNIYRTGDWPGAATQEFPHIDPAFGLESGWERHLKEDYDKTIDQVVTPDAARKKISVFHLTPLACRSYSGIFEGMIEKSTLDMAAFFIVAAALKECGILEKGIRRVLGLKTACGAGEKGFEI